MNNSIKKKADIPVHFSMVYETHPLKKFQDEGHFVPATRHRDANGVPTGQPRKFRGAIVHALTLFDLEGVQIARSVSDSREECDRLIADQIRAMFWGSQKALQIAIVNQEQATKSKNERDRLVNWMLANRPAEDLSKVLGISEAAIEGYKRSQEDPELQAKVEALKRGKLPL